MTAEENKALVLRFMEEVYNKRNLDVLEEFIAPDAVGRNASGRAYSDLRGPEYYRGFLSHWWQAFPDITFTMEDVVAEGDRVVTRTLWRGTHLGTFRYGPSGPIAATGKQMVLADVLITRLAGGKIVEEWESVNWVDLWEQLGAL